MSRVRYTICVFALVRVKGWMEKQTRWTCLSSFSLWGNISFFLAYACEKCIPVCEWIYEISEFTCAIFRQAGLALTAIWHNDRLMLSLFLLESWVRWTILCNQGILHCKYNQSHEVLYVKKPKCAKLFWAIYPYSFGFAQLKYFCLKYKTQSHRIQD